MSDSQTSVRPNVGTPSEFNSKGKSVVSTSPVSTETAISIKDSLSLPC